MGSLGSFSDISYRGSCAVWLFFYSVCVLLPHGVAVEACSCTVTWTPVHSAWVSSLAPPCIGHKVSLFPEELSAENLPSVPLGAENSSPIMTLSRQLGHPLFSWCLVGLSSLFFPHWALVMPSASSVPPLWRRVCPQGPAPHSGVWESFARVTGACYALSYPPLVTFLS